jgi:hypothetical protein
MASNIALAWPRVDGFVLSISGLHCSKPWRYTEEKKRIWKLGFVVSCGRLLTL